jgi:hypothetical protein
MDSASSPDTLTWLYWAAAVVAVLLALFIYVVIRKGRLLPGDHVFRASRLGRGNRLLPAQVGVTHESVTFFQPQWIGKMEESIHITHVASIKIATHLLLSDVFIETTGGRDPIVCHGHTKHDAVGIKQVIEQFQSEYYKMAKPTA